MQDVIIQLMNQFGYWGIALLIAIENIFPPIPSEVILTFGGFMTTYTQMNAWGVILFATAGALVGALVLYAVGRFLSPERLERWLTGKIGRALGFKPGDVQKATDWFSRRGKSTVFFCRCIPIVRSLISIPAGTTKMKLPTFLLYTTAGTLIWNTLLVYLGVFAGASWERIVSYTDTYTTITLLIIIVILAVCAFWFVKKRLLHRKNEENKENSEICNVESSSSEDSDSDKR